MPILTPTLDYIDFYLKNRNFPELRPPELTDSEIQSLYDDLNIRFKGTDGEWMCFLGSKPGVSAYSDSKIKALALLVARLEMKKEDFL